MQHPDKSLTQQGVAERSPVQLLAMGVLALLQLRTISKRSMETSKGSGLEVPSAWRGKMRRFVGTMIPETSSDNF